MKQNVKRINESQLKDIIAKSVKSVVNEDFRPVDNLSDYIRQNNIQMRQASKFARINAIQAQGGERINTVASDGTQETTNVAKQGDWIVNNVDNPQNKWIIDPVTFAKKYQPDPSKDGVYMPKGGPMMAGQINEPISFNAPWGERMNIDKGGYLMQTPGSETDIYGISGPDFDNTYRFNESKIYKNMKNVKRINESQLKAIVAESVKKVLKESGYIRNLDGSMPPYQKQTRDFHDFTRGVDKSYYEQSSNNWRRINNQDPYSQKPTYDKDAAKQRLGLEEGYNGDVEMEEYYQTSDEVLNKVGALLFQAQQILEPNVNFEDGSKYLKASQQISHCWHEIKYL